MLHYVFDKMPMDVKKKIGNSFELSEQELFNELFKLGIKKSFITELIKKTYDLEYIDLKKETFPTEISNKFKLDVLYKRGFIPFKVEEKTIFVATNGKKSEDFALFLEKQGYVPSFFYAFKFEIDHFYNQHNKTSKVEIVEYKEGDINELVDSIIQGAIIKDASDIHIEPQKEIIKVRYRVDGVLVSHLEIKNDGSILSNLTSRLKIISGLDIAENRKPQDGRIVDYQHNKKIFDIRLSTVNTIFGEKIVMRLLDKNGDIPSFEQLGVEKSESQKLESILNKNNGIVLLVGATGSGKTTTLYSMIDYVNSEDINISTIEDPVEKDIKGINQVQVSNYVTYADILKSFLRQDPDVIVIGEVRDNETADLAIRSAMTGHLVLATLHAKNIQEAPIRLANMGIDKYLIANTTVGILSQRLVRKICSHCKTEYELSDYEKEWIEEVQGRYKDVDVPDKLYKGEGCASCNYTGYKKRTAIIEVVKIDDKEIFQILNGQRLEDYNPIEKIALQKVSRGETTIREVLQNI